MNWRVLTVLGLAVAAIGLWYVLDGREPARGTGGWQPDLRSDPEVEGPAVASPPIDPMTVERSPAAAPGADAAPRPAGGTVVPGAPGLPLANVVVPHAQWDDVPGRAVLDELAKAAGKRLSLAGDVRRRLRTLRVTLDVRDATVAKLLDLVLRPHEDLNWTMRGGKIQVYVDDAD